MSWASLCHHNQHYSADCLHLLSTFENTASLTTTTTTTNLHRCGKVLAPEINYRLLRKASKTTSKQRPLLSSVNALVTLLFVSLTFFISASMASPILDSKQSSNLGDMLLKPTVHPAAEITSSFNLKNDFHLHRRHVRSITGATNGAPEQPSPVCLVQFVERRSCRPIATPTDWETDVVDDSSASVEATDTAELRYHEVGYNAPSLRLTPYNNNPHDKSTYFIERPVPGAPGVFTLQTLSSREFICVSRRGRLRLHQAPDKKRRCWWMAGKMAFGTYGQQRHSMALISARHYPNLANATLISPSANHTANHHRQMPHYQQLQIKLSSPGSLTNHWVVGFRRDGRPLPSYAPKLVNLDKLSHNDHHHVENLALDTFLFSRLVVSAEEHDNHGFSTASCHEALQRHNNYARHLTFC